jgi:valyl-tRNA synthetase
MAALAGVSGFSADGEALKPAHSATIVASGMEVYVPLEGLVDFEAEAQRVAREAQKLAAELEKLNRKLSNEGFLAKASADIIAKDRAKAAELSEALVLVQAQLVELA